MPAFNAYKGGTRHLKEATWDAWMAADPEPRNAITQERITAQKLDDQAARDYALRDHIHRSAVAFEEQRKDAPTLPAID
ncbi:MAG TPA: hypothetical protein VGM39_25465 [Kofleriaceae bacterium]|jgi:hypothetical protein